MNKVKTILKGLGVAAAVPVVLVAMVVTVGIAHASQNNAPKKYFVCKYVGTPGLNETLQTGQNPISVSENALTPPIVVGAYFNDQHGRSLVVAEDTGQSDPSCTTPKNDPCQYDATLLATDPKCVKPADPCPAPKVVVREQCVDPTPPADDTPDPFVPTADGGMRDTVTGEVFYGK